MEAPEKQNWFSKNTLFKIEYSQKYDLPILLEDTGPPITFEDYDMEMIEREDEMDFVYKHATNVEGTPFLTKADLPKEPLPEWVPENAEELDPFLDPEWLPDSFPEEEEKLDSSPTAHDAIVTDLNDADIPSPWGAFDAFPHPFDEMTVAPYQATTLAHLKHVEEAPGPDYWWKMYESEEEDLEENDLFHDDIEKDQPHIDFREDIEALEKDAFGQAGKYSDPNKFFLPYDHKETPDHIDRRDL
eukprot:TRINITY_DN7964_c0_g1_i1.p1 TRINITY_DN7964_c0_g1~~TRINITY_DN7964_c0_g1_i1.p1  ORF type:complete len:254 (+),score=44.73 TRINITY_DN7964_c0_g1_i1:33-764(+)